MKVAAFPYSPVTKPIRIIAPIAAFLAVICGFWIHGRREPKAGQRNAPASHESERTADLATVSAPVVRTDAIAAFREWSDQYTQAQTAEERRAMLDQGITLASARRTELKALIATNAREAIAAAVPPVVRQQLPRAIVERLEERVNEEAFFGVLGALPGAGSDVGPPIRRHVRTDDGASYRAFVFGARAQQPTTERASIVGIAVDDFLAVDESPLRVVQAGEIPNHPNNLTQRRRVMLRDSAGFSSDRVLMEQGRPKPLVDTCPISGVSTPLPESSEPVSNDQPVVEAQGSFQFLCSGGHIHAFRESLVAREGGNGGPIKPSNLPAATQSTGFKSNLLMRVAFPETNKESISEKEGYQLGKDVEDWFVDSSYGRLSFITTVTPILILPRTEAWYKDVDTDGDAFEVLADARAASKAAGFDPANFDFDTVIYTGSPGSFGGQAYVGGKGCWLKSGTGVGVACHEYGHNFGLWHANFWNTGGVSVIGNGSHVEYGDNFDTMGSASAGDLQFNACHKNLLGWIPDAQIHTVRTGGTYRIYQMDQPRQDPALRYAIKIRKDSDRDYWVDLRQRSFSSNRWVAGGVFLHWSPWVPSAGGSHLLDTTPGSPDDKTDAPIVIGRTFSDMEAGIHITPVAKNSTTPVSFDVVVNLGTFPGNQAPLLDISADQTSVNTNATVTFSATATDADGDSLSYWWDFGDKNFATTNTAGTSKSWATAGDYVVRCVASDMKGGTASKAVVVRVGSPTVYSVTGTITLNGRPLPGVRVHNGLTVSNYRGSYTNSDGIYVIAGLNAGSYTIGAAFEGYTFSATSAATVTVGPNAVVDFSAADSPRLSITAVTPVVAEGAGGTLRLSRTGSTVSALTVNMLFPGGFATKGSDYTLTPDLTSGTTFYTVSIPAGQSDLNIAFNAQNDTGQEGPESATFEVVPGSNYVLTNSSATITIDDPDTTKPLVRLITVDNDASEDGGTGGFVIERFGSTSSALNVSVAMSGSATNGTDYQSIPATIVIPPGESQAAVALTPVADALTEGPETATITISTSSAYIRAPSSADYAGTITITDAQTPVVSLVASDAAASEAGNDPGIFVISRSGSTAQALVVQLGLTGSALQGVDYATIPAQVTIPAGSDFTTVVVTPVDDGIGEPAQTVRLYLRAASGYSLGSAVEGTVTITDNADVPYVTIGTTGSALESGTNGTFRITTHGTGSGNVTVNYAVSGTATNGSDFTALPGSISIGKNTTATISVVPIQDTDIEGYETVTLTLTPDAAYTLGVDRSATLNIVDDELPQVNVSTTNSTFSESSGTARFFVSRTGATTAAMTVNYTMSGTATSGTDYTAPSGSVTIAAGNAGAYVDIPILADAIQEGTETIVLSVAPDAAYSAGIGSATYYLDDAQSPTLSLRFNPNIATIAEGGGPATATVTLSGASPNTVTVQVLLTGGTALGGGIDHTFAGDLLVFEPGETSKTVSIPLTDDTVPEANETITLVLDNPTGNTRLSNTTSNTVFTLTVTDNDTAPPPTVGFTATAGTGGEAVAAAPLYVTLSSAQAAPVTVDYAVTGGTASVADHGIVAGTLTFAAGEIAKVIPSAIADDAEQESNETVIVSLSAPTGGVALGANASYTYTITDNDAMSLSIAATTANAAEPAGNGLFTITRAGATASETTVNLLVTGTATQSADYVAIPVTATLAAGSSTVTIPVVVNDDTVGEGSETVIVTLAAGAYSIGSPASATVTIADNEPDVSLVATDAAAAEAGADPGIIVISRTGSTASALTLDATISGTATAGADYAGITIPISIPAGSASLAIPVTPIDDALAEGAETVILTLNAAAGYRLTGPTSATVTIADDDVNSPPAVVIDSPTVGNVVLPAGVGLILEATVSDDGKPAGGTVSTWSKLSGPGVVTFGNAADADTSALFGAPGTYVLRLAANDGALTTNADITVSILPAEQQWTGTNVTGTTPAGNFTDNAGTITVQGGGTNISGTTDTFFFVNRALVGNCDFRARVVSMSGGASSAKAGVMIRQSTAGGSRGAYMSAYGTGGSTVSWRTRATDGASWATSNTTGTPSFPRWVRVVRTGNSYTGFTSTNGTTWTATGSAGTVNMTEPMLIGLAVTSNNTSALCTALFDNVSITMTSNVAPFVSAGPNGSVVLPEPVALGGSVSDDGLPVAFTTTWEKRSGPGLVQFADATSPSTTAQFSVPGTYVLRLIADDSQVKTFSDAVVTTSLPELNITANAPSASEQNGGVAAYTIVRSGAGSSSMQVNFTVGGSAVESDYSDPSEVLHSGAATIDFGNTSTVVSAGIVKDAVVEGTETLTLTLAANGSFAVGVNSSATVNILDAPVISIAATDAVATELGLTSGTITATRSGDLSDSLAFSAVRGGSAIAGSDYADPGPVFEFPAGQASLIIPIQPLADAVAEGPETATLTVVEGAAFAVSGAPAVVTIEDLPADSWRFGKFGADSGNPLISGDLADPDGDGLVNLLEYAFALEPLAVDPPAEPSLGAAGLSIIYRRNLLATDLEYLIQKSTDAAFWMPAAPIEDVLSDDGSVRVIRATIPVGVDPAGFLRVRVARP
ncbi:MAG: hypothetical protein RL088_1440 [Verrucomicrobiota bacterium]|jgi:hypothetical protein